MEKEILKERLAQKVKRLTGVTCSYAVNRAELLLWLCPDEIYQNLEEWAEDKPLSEIRFEGYTLEEVMKIQKCSILSAVWLLSSAAINPEYKALIAERPDSAEERGEAGDGRRDKRETDK